MRLPKIVKQNIAYAHAKGHSVVSQGCAYFRCTRCPAKGYLDVYNDAKRSEFAAQCTNVLISPALIKEAMGYLRAARDVLKDAQCPKTVARVRLALTSAQGALRNAEHHVGVINRGETPRKRIKRAQPIHVVTRKWLNDSYTHR